MSETCEDSLHNTVFNHKWCLPNTKKSFCCCFSRWPPLSCGVVDNTFGCGGESPSSSPGRGNTWEYRNVLFWVKFLENFGEINFSVQFHDFRAGFNDPQRWVLVSRFFESVEPRKSELMWKSFRRRFWLCYGIWRVSEKKSENHVSKIEIVPVHKQFSMFWWTVHSSLTYRRSMILGGMQKVCHSA